jgi:hypothetical protein
MLVACGSVYGVSDSNLVAHWEFDEGAGTIAHDSVGINHGTIHGVQWTTGQAGNALNFDGINDYVEVPDNPSLRFSQSDSFSISCWAMPVVGDGGRIVCKMRKNSAVGVFGYETLWHSELSEFCFSAESSCRGYTVVRTGEGSAPAGNWYHFTAVYSNKNITLYLNGEPAGGGTFAHDAGSTTPDKNLSIGVRSYDSTMEGYFEGLVDDVRIYNRALSAQEVWQVYVGSYYVDATNGDDKNNGMTPKTAFATIQKGIDSAEDGDTVIVFSGRYTGDGNRDLDFKGKAITVRNTDPNDPNIVAATIIDCNGTKEYPHRGFYFHTGEDTNSIMEGFTITNGYGPNEPFSANTYSAGGAIFCNNSSPTVRKCIITKNYSDFWGGGLWFSNSRSVVAECTFKENKSGDTGGGLYDRLGGVTVTKCLFISNSAVAGGGMYNVDGTPTVRNSIFVGNLASLKGGAVRNNRVTATIMNCTFFDNQAPEGGAIHNIDSWGTITNCILWKNPNTEIEGTAIVSYCDVMGGWPDEGNIDTDPLFADANEGDFHLRSQIGRWDPRTKSWVQDSATSRCIDAGDPNDPVGYEPNPNGDRINQGAYGGTAEASKSPYCAETLLSDLNHDCRVDFIDFAIFVSEWLECRIEPPEFCWQ